MFFTKRATGQFVISSRGVIKAAIIFEIYSIGNPILLQKIPDAVNWESRKIFEI